MKDKIFGVLQRVGRSFMLPIALLPVAGLLLGLGSSFTNTTMLETYNLMGIMGPGTVIYSILSVMSAAGNSVFANLPLIFAVGVAIGMAKKEKEVAALAAAIAFIIMHTSISTMLLIGGGGATVAESCENLVSSGFIAANSYGDILGITTLNMGVFGGIIVGLGVAALHNRFYRIELPQVLSFFGGTRFVPIISSVVEVAVGERLGTRGMRCVEPVAAAAQQQLEVVGALADVRRDVELGGCQRIVDLGRLPVVDPQRAGRARILQMEVDAAVGPGIGNLDLLLQHGAEGPFGDDARLGPEVDGMARRSAVAGFGVVARVVRNGLRAVDAGALLGPGAGQGEKRSTKQYGMFHHNL